MPKLWLGTAQFGIDYGVSNAAGRISRKDAAVILDQAASTGVDTLDTAPAYGESEEILGELGAARRFRIVTKTPTFRAARLTAAEGGEVERSLDGSLAKLRTGRVHGLLSHWCGDLLAPGGDHVYKALCVAKADGRVERIGASVYDMPEAEVVLDRYAIDFIQVPLNVFDQRFLRSGFLAGCAARGVAVHSRSAFMQGLLLMDPSGLPARLNTASAPLVAFHAAAGRAGATPLEACLGFVFGVSALEGVLCGVAGIKDFAEIAAVVARGGGRTIDFAALAVDTADVIDPRRWVAA